MAPSLFRYVQNEITKAPLCNKKVTYRRRNDDGEKTLFHDDAFAFSLFHYVAFVTSLWRLCYFCFIKPHVNFQRSDWSIGRVTILNVTRQCLTAVKFVVEMGHSL